MVVGTAAPSIVLSGIFNGFGSLRKALGVIERDRLRVAAALFLLWLEVSVGTGVRFADAQLMPC